MAEKLKMPSHYPVELGSNNNIRQLMQIGPFAYYDYVWYENTPFYAVMEFVGLSGVFYKHVLWRDKNTGREYCMSLDSLADILQHAEIKGGLCENMWYIRIEESAYGLARYQQEESYEVVPVPNDMLGVNNGNH